MAIDAALGPEAVPPVPPARSRRHAIATAALGLLAATLAGAALAVGLTARALALLAGSSVRSVDQLVEVAVCGVGALVAGWLAASALLALGCLGIRLVGSTWRVGERVVHRCAPAVVRRALVLMVGATVGLGAATGASAAPAPTPSEPAGPVVVATADDLGWVVTAPADTPDPAAGEPSTTSAESADGAEPVATVAPVDPPAAPPSVPVATTVVAPAPMPTSTSVPVGAVDPVHPGPAAPSTDTASVVVVAGDSLWTIAARHLPPHATDAEIAASWPQWYATNARVIGADPGLIVPGQELSAPVAQDAASS